MSTKIGMKRTEPRKPMKRITAKKSAELRLEKKLVVELFNKQKGLCADCGKP